MRTADIGKILRPIAAAHVKAPSSSYLLYVHIRKLVRGSVTFHCQGRASAKFFYSLRALAAQGSVLGLKVCSGCHRELLHWYGFRV